MEQGHLPCPCCPRCNQNTAGFLAFPKDEWRGECVPVAGGWNWISFKVPSTQTCDPMRVLPGTTRFPSGISFPVAPGLAAVWRGGAKPWGGFTLRVAERAASPASSCQRRGCRKRRLLLGAEGLLSGGV